MAEDRYNRGGGSLSKATGEMCHCVNASGHDIKAFCAVPIHALVAVFPCKIWYEVYRALKGQYAHTLFLIPILLVILIRHIFRMKQLPDEMPDYDNDTENNRR